MEKEPIETEDKEKWEHVGYFGYSKILASGNKRKLVEEDGYVFEYETSNLEKEQK